MADEAKVRVRLDTSQALASLSSFVREGARAAGQLSDGLRSTIGGGLRAVGLGGAVGVGVQAVRGATESSTGDVFGEALSGMGAKIAEWAFGDLDDEARAKRRTREEAIQTFGAVASKGITPEMRAWFAGMHRVNMQRELGRGVIEREEMFHGPGIEKVIDRILGGLKTLFFDAADRIIQGLNPFKYF